MSIIAITDYRERAKALLLQQFDEGCAPNLNKLLDVYMAEVQALEDELIKLLNNRNITDALGDQLDTIGSILGLDRQGLSDDDYRAALRVQIIVNNGGGEEPTIAALIRSLTAATTIDIQERFPAGLEIFINLDDLSLNTIQNLRRAVAAAVDMQFAYTSGALPFAFDGDSVGAGFSGDDPATGGEFAVVVNGV